MGMATEIGLRRHHEARRAETALLRVVLDEGRRNRVELVLGRQALDRLNVSGGMPPPLDNVYREDRTGIDGLAIHDYRAGPAGTAVADFFGPCQIEVITQGIEQRYAGFTRHSLGLPVDAQRQRRGAGANDDASRRRLGLKQRAAIQYARGNCASCPADQLDELAPVQALLRRTGFA